MPTDLAAEKELRDMVVEHDRLSMNDGPMKQEALRMQRSAIRLHCDKHWLEYPAGLQDNTSQK